MVVSIYFEVYFSRCAAFSGSDSVNHGGCELQTTTYSDCADLSIILLEKFVLQKDDQFPKGLGGINDGVVW